MHCLESLTRAFREHPDRVFCHFVDRQGTRALRFYELVEKARGYGLALRERGVQRGDLVLIFLPHTPDQHESFLGAMSIGAIPSFMPTPSAKQHASRYWAAHAALLDRIRPVVVISDPLHAQQMRDARIIPDCIRILETTEVEAAPGELELMASPDDIALLQHSSGTTGLKKGVALSHRAISNQIRAYQAALRICDGDTIISWLPLYHDMGLIACFMLPLALGLPVVEIDPFHWVANPALLFDAIADFNGTHVWMPNFAFDHLCRVVGPSDHFDLHSIKAFINCSEPCKPGTFARFLSTYAKNGVTAEMLQVCYAMAETVFAATQTEPRRAVEPLIVDPAVLRECGRVVCMPRDNREPSLQGLVLLPAGRPVGGLEVTIVTDDGVPLAEDSVGEISVRGNFLFDGYFRLPNETASRLLEGAYMTRDLGFFHNGELYVLGRKDDLIIVNGRNYYAHDIEALLSGIEGIKAGRVVAIGFFNPEIGSEEMAVIAELANTSCETNLLRRKVRQTVFDLTGLLLRDILFVENGWLVKTTSGKVSREANRDKYLRRQEAPAHTPS